MTLAQAGMSGTWRTSDCGQHWPTEPQKTACMRGDEPRTGEPRASPAAGGASRPDGKKPLLWYRSAVSKHGAETSPAGAGLCP